MVRNSNRKSLEDTWQYLESQGTQAPRHPDGRPLVHDAMPNHDDDEPFGVRHFRTHREDADYGNLTMPRTFFGRSWLIRVSFANADLSSSRMCWNDFDECDFSNADLSGCDLRASQFKGCTFRDAVLRGADLRRSSFEDCDFAGADLAGAVAEEEDGDGCFQDYLTDEQRAAMAWTPDGGPEPPGG
jgi:uncharacterized protein YjbI with pentapeptide repeats